MSFGALHHSVVSASKSWWAFCHNSEKDARVTLSFEVSFVRNADINNSIPKIFIVRDITEHHVIVEDSANSKISCIVNSLMLRCLNLEHALATLKQVSGLDKYHLIFVRAQDYLRLDIHYLDRIDDFKSRGGIDKLKTIIRDKHTVVPSVRHVEAAEDVFSVDKINIKCLLSDIKPVLEHTCQLIRFIEEVGSGDFDHNLRHRLNEDFFFDLVKLDSRVVSNVQKSEVL